ncbi:hypothetical protein AJ80_09503 [Polytolypa hystricis UAMH7299]|uniref:J domain-containing protein n=1 Tax=Polytolypa hystricis (strain UAMH7299) TaxID=1447883 RepID=A0A2B7WPZ8_POLH7|nr:hypothetical protein AJ80_09503 [Polytolypa hystricis UAMH7299]
MAGSITYPSLSLYSPVSSTQPEAESKKRSKESPPPEEAPAPKLSKVEQIIAHQRTPPATPEPETVQDKGGKKKSRLEIVSKPPFPSVSDATDDEQPRKFKAAKGKKSLTSNINNASGSSAEQSKSRDPKDVLITEVMKASSPYEILGIPDPSELEVIIHAFKRRRALLHPDKNPGKDTTDAFKKVYWAAECLEPGLDWNKAAKSKAAGEPKPQFKGNAFDTEPEDGIDEDGDTAMKNPQESNPVPDARHHKLYAQATPFIISLFENPDDAEAREALKKINTSIVAQNKKDGLTALDQVNSFTIRYESFAGLVKVATEHWRILQKAPVEQFITEYMEAKCAIDRCNDAIAENVQLLHYPRGWKVRFSLSPDGRFLRREYPEEKKPVPSNDSGPSALGKTGKWKPGKTRKGEPILGCRELVHWRKRGRNLKHPEVFGYRFIVQSNGRDSRICEIRSGSDIGWRATNAYLELPDKRMIRKIDESYNEDITKILKVAYSPEKPSLGMLVCVEVPGRKNGIDWIPRTTLRKILGKADADAEIEDIFEEEGKTPHWKPARLDYKPRRWQHRAWESDATDDDITDSDLDSASETETQHNGSSGRPTSWLLNRVAGRSGRATRHSLGSDVDSDSEGESSHNRSSKHYRGKRSSGTRMRGVHKRMLKATASQEEDPEFAELIHDLYNRIAKMNRNIDRVMAKVGH